MPEKHSVFRDINRFVEKPEPIADYSNNKDKVVQISTNERYDIFVVLESGRVFRARARGQSGSYDKWQEVDIIGQIREDIEHL